MMRSVAFSRAITSLISFPRVHSRDPGCFVEVGSQLMQRLAHIGHGLAQMGGRAVRQDAGGDLQPGERRT